MKEWEIIVAATVALIFIIRSIYHAASVLGYRLDELHEKVDTLQAKLDEIEDNKQAPDAYVNPIDMDR